MIHLPLYRGSTLAKLPVEREEPASVDPLCGRCPLPNAKDGSLRRGLRICVPAEGDPGGLLVVGDAPTMDDNSTGEYGVPFAGREVGLWVRRAVAELWSGPVAYVHAIRCAPGSTQVKESYIEACSGYLAKTIADVQPQRILAMGQIAIAATAGRWLSPLTVRGGYTYMSTGVPVFYLPHPLHAAKNRFVKKWWLEDLQAALTGPLPPRAPVEGIARLVSNVDDARVARDAIVAGAAAGKWVAFDCETMGWMWTSTFRIASLALCLEGDADAWVWTTEALNDPETLAVLRDVMIDGTIRKVGQNVKFDAMAVRSGLGFDVAGISGDTRLWRKLLFSDAEADLETMAELIGMGGHKDESQLALDNVIRRLHGKKPGKAKPLDDGPLSAAETDALLDLWDVDDEGTIDPAIEAAVRLGEPPKRYAYGLLPKAILHRYCARDAVSTARLGVKFEAELVTHPPLRRMWDQLIGPASLAIERVERWGVNCDPEIVSNFEKHLSTRLAEIQANFSAYPQMNPSSVPSLTKFLYTDLGLPVMKTTEKGNPSTDEEALQFIKHLHPVVSDLLDWRHFTKMHGTYAKGMYDHIRPDGRVHPNFKLDGARSGRLSCSEPNLQNIPRPKASPEGRMARDCFTAPAGFTLLQADYSQLELRVAAMLSGDPVMQEIFASGVDYHQRTAEMISMLAWRIPPEQVQSEHRTQAKAVNFGVLYGLGDGGLAAQIGCSKKQAAAVREAIMGKFKVLAQWIRARLAESRRTGEVWTWWDGEPGRCRSLYRIADPDDAVVSVQEHSSWNSQIQGTASDFCLASLVAIVNWILTDGIEDKARLVLSVHDSLLLEVREDFIPVAAKKLHDVMTSWNSLGVPLGVDLEIGNAWGSLQKTSLAKIAEGVR